MKTFYALLRAVLSQDMSLFKIHTKSRASKLILPIILAATVMLSIGSYAYTLMSALPDYANVVLLSALFVATLLTLLEGVYKSGSVLFDSKDNDLLLALPLSRRQVFAVRVLKLIIFQFYLNLVLLSPILIIYAVLIRPAVSFYLLAPLLLLLLPLIPTALAALIAYLIRRISVHFRMPKLIQSVLMIVFFFALFFILDGLTPLTENLTLLASPDSIQNTLIPIYYPCGVFIELLQSFSFLKFIIFLAINILPFVLVVWVGSFNYFKIISRSQATQTSGRTSRPTQISAHSPLSALISKELSRFFSSTVYMFNTLPSLVILIALTIALCCNAEGLISSLTSLEDSPFSAAQIFAFLPGLIFLVSILIYATVSITSSSISIEGRSFNTTKALPLSPAQILLAKVLASLIIICPPAIACMLALTLRFQISLIMSLALLLATIVFPFLFGVIGLFFNLKYPKLDAPSDTEVVKQSLSPMLSLVANLIIFALVAAASTLLNSVTSFAVPIIVAATAILTVLAWRILVYYGRRRLAEIVA